MFNYMIDVCVLASASALAALVGGFCFETLRDV
jgi:hypothetical protein